MVVTDDTEFELSLEREGSVFCSKSRDLDGDVDAEQYPITMEAVMFHRPERKDVIAACKDRNWVL